MYLHVGILHLAMNLITQVLIGIQLEKGLGFFRMAFIYTMSGIGGNLLSALFLPRILEVGASSSIFGLFGIYFVDLLVNWRLHLNRYVSKKKTPPPNLDGTFLGTNPWR